MSHNLSLERGDPMVPLLDETIGDNLHRTVSRLPQREAIVDCSSKRRITFEQLWNDTSELAAALIAHGVRPGDRVGLWSTNRYEWVVVQYATARVGAILVNVNPANRKDELAFVLRQSGMHWLFHGDRFKQTEYAPILDAVRPECPQLVRCVDFNRQWRELLDGPKADHETLAQRSATLRPTDPINIQYTSGTTGFPKGATLTHRNILNNANHMALGLGYSEKDRVCVPVPFYHCFGMVLGTMACAISGACMVIPGEIFNPLDVLKAVQGEWCTSLYGVPTMYRAVLEHPEYDCFDVTSLRTGMMAGSPCPIELMKEVVSRLHMPEIVIGYGMTETSPLSTLSPRDCTLERRCGSVGRSIPQIEISVRDEDNQPVPRGTPGEFCARGYHIMHGYWNDEAATRKAIDADGWMHSGDQATIDDEGFVRITGRLKDLIIRGGENIAPRAVESVLEKHPAVSEAQVIGVPSIRYGEEVMAWIKFRPGMSATEAELIAFSDEQMAAYKRPRYWRFVDSFPLTMSGKIQKYKLREMAIELLALQEAAREKTA
ncbi:MAG: AMP-binding protein [Planctomycetes bacterium]|nr:AMP-binding protein [Planctomycetota bacterium]